MNIEIGEVLENKQIADMFLCSNQGGIRKSLKTKSIILITKFDCDTYRHRQQDGIFYFVGQGKKGDQSLTRQNKSLAQAHIEGFKLYLFEMYEAKKYKFFGEVYLYASPQIESQLDEDGVLRDVFVFPLKKE